MFNIFPISTIIYLSREKKKLLGAGAQNRAHNLFWHGVRGVMMKVTMGDSVRKWERFYSIVISIGLDRWIKKNARGDLLMAWFERWDERMNSGRFWRVLRSVFCCFALAINDVHPSILGDYIATQNEWRTTTVPPMPWTIEELNQLFESFMVKTLQIRSASYCQSPSHVHTTHS